MLPKRLMYHSWLVRVVRMPLLMVMPRYSMSRRLHFMKSICIRVFVLFANHCPSCSGSSLQTIRCCGETAVYGSKGPLRPTQRFWNIKQLASTPADALAIPVSSSKKNVNCAAFGNMVRGEYAVHMVNNGADCEAVISGIPAEVKELKVYVTNTKDCMKETAVKVENGLVRVHLPAISFITLLSDK